MASKFVFLAWVSTVASCLPALPAAPPGGGQATSGATTTGTGECGSGSWRSGWLEIHHIDAGEGVSTLIVSPAGRSLLIDAGEAAWDSDDGAKVVGAYVRGVLGCARLDYVVLSHFHVDHVGFPGHGGVWHLAHEQGFVVGKLLHRDLYRYAGASSGTVDAWRASAEPPMRDLCDMLHQRLSPQLAEWREGTSALLLYLKAGDQLVEGLRLYSNRVYFVSERPC